MLVVPSMAADDNSLEALYRRRLSTLGRSLIRRRLLLRL
jgi:hypothetical protein